MYFISILSISIALLFQYLSSFYTLYFYNSNILSQNIYFISNLLISTLLESQYSTTKYDPSNLFYNSIFHHQTPYFSSIIHNISITEYIPSPFDIRIDRLKMADLASLEGGTATTGRKIRLHAHIHAFPLLAAILINDNCLPDDKCLRSWIHLSDSGAPDPDLRN